MKLKMKFKTNFKYLATCVGRACLSMLGISGFVPFKQPILKIRLVAAHLTTGHKRYLFYGHDLLKQPAPKIIFYLW
jgi:hypothetical protein